jgi:hypothetical protein
MDFSGIKTGRISFASFSNNTVEVEYDRRVKKKDAVQECTLFTGLFVGFLFFSFFIWFSFCFLLFIFPLQCYLVITLGSG